jgi:hypothetical protein
VFLTFLWFSFQIKYEALAGRPLHLNLRRQAKIDAILTVLLWSAMTSFPFLTLNEMRPWFAIPFSYSMLCGVMNIAAWHLSTHATVTAAKALMEQVEHVSDSDGGSYSWSWITERTTIDSTLSLPPA